MPPAPPDPARLLQLYESPDWPVFADLMTACCEQWRNNLARFSLGSTIEQLALERVKWTAMIHGVEQVCVELQRLLTDYKTSLESLTTDGAPAESRTRRPITNPYREGATHDDD